MSDDNGATRPGCVWIAVTSVLSSVIVGAVLSAAGVGLFYLVFTFVIEPNPPEPRAYWALRVLPGPFGFWGNLWLWGAGAVAVFALPSMTVQVWRQYRPRSPDRQGPE